MPHYPARLRLTGATILRDGALQRRSVAVEDGRISKGPLPEVDLTGFYILPGIVDLHGCALKRQLAGPPAARPRLAEALRICDGIAARNGITTGWLAHDWSWEGGIHAPEHCNAFLRALEAYRTIAMTDLQAQILCDVNTVDSQDYLLATVRRHAVGSVLFRNELESARQMAEAGLAALSHHAHGSGRSIDAHLAALERAEARRRDVPRHLCRLSEAFDALGVVYGSRGDSDGETREYYTQIGAKVCALPQRRAAAALARAVGDPILLSASEVTGSKPAQTPDLLRAGLGDALVSGEEPGALVQAAFRLASEGIMDLPKAWEAVSARPAALARLTDRGIIDYDRRADLVIVHAGRRTVEATLVGGRLVWVTGEAAERFAPARATTGLAAE